MKSVSGVIPAYNEEACVGELVERLGKIFAKEAQYQ
jgi:hypothetical protein